MRYRALGGVSVEDDSGIREFTERQAAVLAILLAASPGTVSRARLIDEIWGESPPKDPDAALHNVVSRLRSVVGDDLRSTRNGYSIDAEDFDVSEFDLAVRKARQTGRVSDFEEAWSVWGGSDPYPGLEDLPSVGIEIERLRGLRRMAILEFIEALLESGEGSRAAEEAHLLVEADPFDERAVGLYMRALYASGRKPEALEAFRDYEGSLAEATGLEPSAEIRELEVAILLDQFEKPARRSRAPIGLEMSIGYIERAPGEQVAVGRSGSGTPLFVHPGWLSKLDRIAAGDDFRSPFFAELAARHELIIFDRYGTGLSQGEPGEFSFRTQVAELQTVLRKTVEGPVTVLAPSAAGPISLTVAAENPDLIGRLVLLGTFADGPATFPERVSRSLLALFSGSWGMGSELLATLLFPGASVEHRELWAQAQREIASKEVALALLEDMYRSSAAAVLPEISVPCLIVHYTGDKAIPYAAAEELARRIPNARLIPIEGVSHYPRPGEEPEIADLIDRFMAETAD